MVRALTRAHACISALRRPPHRCGRLPCWVHSCTRRQLQVHRGQPGLLRRWSASRAAEPAPAGFYECRPLVSVGCHHTLRTLVHMHVEPLGLLHAGVARRLTHPTDVPTLCTRHAARNSPNHGNPTIPNPYTRAVSSLASRKATPSSHFR